MAKGKMIELSTTRDAEARLTEPLPPQTIMVVNLNGRLYFDALGRWWPCFGPARLWRFLDGRNVGSVAAALALALLAVGGAAWALWRLFGAGR